MIRNNSIAPQCIWLFGWLLLLSGCTATKFLDEGQRFYTGAKIEINQQGKIGGQKRIKKDLEEFITPKPNATILGMRPGVWFYYKAGNPKKEKGLSNLIKNKLGRQPVLLSDASPEKTTLALEGQLQNTGYFGSEVQSSIETRKKESTVTYTVELHPPFNLRNINERLFDSIRYSEITQLIEDKPLLKEGQRFKLDALQAEQVRIEELLANQGFYFFDDRYLIFEADTTVGNRQVDLDLKFEKGMLPKATRVYKMKNIAVYPNYSIENDSLDHTSDTFDVDEYTYVDNQRNFIPSKITDVINLKPGGLYSRFNHEYTISHLMGMKTFKFVNIKYEEDPTDSSALNASIYLTPLLKKSIRIQVQGVSKSNNFIGPNVELTFTNRNVFRGAELLQFKLNSSYGVQISRQQAGALNAFELGAELSLSIPRFVAPFNIHYINAKYLPQTQFKLAYNLQQRLRYFKLNSFNAAYGFTWRETTLKTHELFPVDVSFVRVGKTSEDFDQLLESNPTLANSFQNQFILGSRYTYTLNTQLKADIDNQYGFKKAQKSHFYFSGNVDISGNLFHTVQKTLQEKDSVYRIFGIPYSQYIKANVDFRYYFQPNVKTKLATRIFVGWGYAYGNSSVLPYIKQFSSGGSNSLRAFPARSVGPGAYNVRTDPNFSNSTFFIDQRGDVKLEGNIEYRFDIYKIFKGAVFMDAGNIWLRKGDNREGSEFDKDTFLDELAVGTGAGVRIDLNFFVLRFDAAFPLRKPYLSQGERWVFEDIRFSDKNWRQQNLILNIAIGYPF